MYATAQAVPASTDSPATSDNPGRACGGGRSRLRPPAAWGGEAPGSRPWAAGRRPARDQGGPPSASGGGWASVRREPGGLGLRH